MFSTCCWCKKTENVILDESMTTGKQKCDLVNNKDRIERNMTELSRQKPEELPILAILDDAMVGGEKRNSVSSRSVQSDSDEVFTDGVVASAKLADNLGTSVGLVPNWFDGEPSTPPATPVGRDELALRRHRLYSEILELSQHVNEHRVKFDPFPVVAGVSDDNYVLRSELEELFSRLENVTLRLEKVCLPIEQIINRFESNSAAVPTIMSLQNFTDIIQGPLTQYLQFSQKIGGDVVAHSQLVSRAFQVQLDYLKFATQSKQPSPAEIGNLLKPTSDQISAIQDYREKHRTSPFFNHLSAVSESIPALGWVTVAPTPAPYVKEMNDAGQFYTNRVLKEWKEKDKIHVEWVKAWVSTLTELQKFVKQHHTTGLVWSGKGGVAAPPPPPPGGLPPPPMPDFDISAAGDNDRSALFAQINQGADITRSLKKVTSDMQTHKNTTLREGPAPFKVAAQQKTQSTAAAAAALAQKAPVFAREGKKWLIEYQTGNNSLVVENAEMNNVVYLFKCTNSSVTVKGKINSIILDSCKKTSVVFDSLVSSLEFINCQSVQMQVLGKVPTISIDKTDGCQMYLSGDSLNVEVVSSKSSEMNVLLPTGNGDYVEHPVPEQYKTTVLPGKGLSTIAIESKG